MAGKDNLKVPTSEEARVNGKKGGLASAKARREKKAFKETLETLLGMTIEDGDGVSIDDIQSLAAAEGRNISVQEAILIAQIKKAMDGDTKAAEYVRDSIGQKPTDKVVADLVMPVFSGEEALED